MKSFGRNVFAVFLASTAAGGAVAGDWPQWNGPTRDGVVAETGLYEEFPAAGLKKKWSAPVHLGYSGPAVASGRVFLTDYVKKSGEIANSAGSRDQLTGTERTLCFDAATGRLLWADAHDRPYSISYGGGPRATPTVDAGKVYILGAEGDLSCLNAADGRPVWRRRLKEMSKTESPMWGWTASPLVVGDQLICLVGGAGGLARSLDKNTGVERWRA
ncbi:MAG: PQQ-binding-like beta-propeller repeat protein, partial [Planctomycetia bacterium]